MGVILVNKSPQKRGVELQLIRYRGTTKYPQTEIREAHPMGEHSA